MTTAVTAYTSFADSREAGQDLGRQIADGLGGAPPDAAVVFASSRFDYSALLRGVDDTCHPSILVGSSSAGEFTGKARGEGTACALALRSSDIRMAAGLGKDVSTDRQNAARQVVSTFKGMRPPLVPYRAALVMADALAGHADDLVEQLTIETAGKYQFAGGGAGDDAQFARTDVFFGTEAYTNAVVALEFLSQKPLGLGVGHGWIEASRPLRVTESLGTRVISLDGFPAVEAYEEYAQQTGQSFTRSEALPFFLHHILGIDTGGGFRLRVPLSVDDAGALICAAEIPVGAKVHIMKATVESAVTAAERATRTALDNLRGGSPGAAVLFDCVATRLRMGEQFGSEVESVARLVGKAGLVGCNTYGQIARAEGQFGGFHNCTAVVMVLPE